MATNNETFLYIPAPATAPDPIGIAKISGRYGSGTWAAWFLTIMGAWLTIFRASEAKVDGNTWSYLIGTNWAAADLLRYVRLVQLAPTDSERMLLLGPYAAAFNITYWGLFHAVWQLCWTFVMFNKHKRAKRRVWTLLASLVLPFIALFASGVQTIAQESMLDFLLTLYRQGMAGNWHSYAIAISAFSLVLLVPTGCYIAISSGDDFFPVAPVRSLFHKISNFIAFPIIICLYVPLSLLIMIFGTITSEAGIITLIWFYSYMLPLMSLVIAVSTPLLPFL